jgi:protein farnesyltransferase/geranylgeranyltransferase type-1 subunit alpha
MATAPAADAAAAHAASADDVADPAACNASASSSPGRDAGDAGDAGSRAHSGDGDDEEGPLDAWAGVACRPLRRAPIATIPYSPRFADVFALLQVARASGEVSARALALVGEAIRLCPADFSSWAYRMVIVRGLLRAAGAGEGAGRERRSLLRVEDAFARATAEKAPKCYQVWEYRRFLCALQWEEEGSGGAEGWDDPVAKEEKALVDAALDADEKNYHAWSHRGWLCRGVARRRRRTRDGARDGWSAQQLDVEESGAGDGELAATAARIRADVRNNSAYAHRWAVGAASRGAVEVRWALDRVRRAPRNEAAWNYALACARRVEGGVALAAGVAREELEEDAGNVPARRFLVLAQGSGACALEEKIAHCRLLATEMDVERYRYWMWKMEKLRGR